MKQLYRNLNQNLSKFSCVNINSYDKCLAGKRGQIWEAGGGSYKAVIYLPTGQEKIVRFEEKDLAKWVRKLEVPLNADDQVPLANRD